MTMPGAGRSTHDVLPGPQARRWSRRARWEEAPGTGDPEPTAPPDLDRQDEQTLLARALAEAELLRHVAVELQQARVTIKRLKEQDKQRQRRFLEVRTHAQSAVTTAAQRVEELGKDLRAWETAVQQLRSELRQERISSEERLEQVHAQYAADAQRNRELIAQAEASRDAVRALAEQLRAYRDGLGLPDDGSLASRARLPA